MGKNMPHIYKCLLRKGCNHSRLQELKKKSTTNCIFSMKSVNKKRQNKTFHLVSRKKSKKKKIKIQKYFEIQASSL